MPGLEEDEVVILWLSAGVAIAGIVWHYLGALHGLNFRRNPAPGIVRLGIFLAMGWIVVVLALFADPSIVGVYNFFYLVMGYAVIKVAGQGTATKFGARTRVDVGERRNVPMAIVIASFIVASGLIFGGSLWGEADPAGDGEGGWWIPLSFFLLGWSCLVAVFGLFLLREAEGFMARLQRERDMDDALAAAFFLISAAIILTDAVAGDFWGWGHGLFTFGVLAGLLVAHEAFASLVRVPRGKAGAEESTSLESKARPSFEWLVYLGFAAVAWGVNRWLNIVFGAV